MSIATPPIAQRLANIQSLRGFAAVLVVFSHLFIIESKYAPDHIFGQWAELGMVGVDLFFVISGFIMVHVAWPHQRGIKSASEFLFARTTRIYPLYWVVSLAVLAVYLWRPDMVFSSYDTPPNLWKSFALFPDSRDPLLAVGWTLIHEIGFYLVFTLAILFKPRRLFPFLCAWLIFLIVGQKAGMADHGHISKLLFSPLTYEFLGGAFAGYIFHKYNGKFGSLALGLGLILWGLTLAMLINRHVGMIESHWGRAIHFTAPSVLVVYGLASLKSTLPKFTQVLGDWSYALYLTHILTLSLLGKAWQSFARQGLWDNALTLIIFTFISILIAGMAHKIVERPMLQLAKQARANLFR